MFEKMKNVDDYLNKILFGDKATSHLSGKVNRHILKIWSTENPHETVEHVRDSPNLNVFCAVSSVKVYGPFLFADFIFPQDGATPHFNREVTSYVNRTVVAWIGRGRKMSWPPRSPDLTSLVFSVWGYFKDKSFVPPLPASLEEMRARITEGVATIDADKFYRIWDEIAYRWDICLVTRENHIESL